jgi:hypothetical protein
MLAVVSSFEFMAENLPRGTNGSRGMARGPFGSRELTIVSSSAVLTPLCHSAIKRSAACDV